MFRESDSFPATLKKELLCVTRTRQRNKSMGRRSKKRQHLTFLGRRASQLARTKADAAIF
jgi:hypothetical protein